MVCPLTSTPAWDAPLLRSARRCRTRRAYLAASLISSAFTVFLPACLASLTALAAISVPYSSRTSARAFAADALTRSAFAFCLIIRSTGASGSFAKSYHRCFSVTCTLNKKITKGLRTRKRIWCLILPRIRPRIRKRLSSDMSLSIDQGREEISVVSP